MKKKETYYFSHDYSTTNDPKIQALLGKFGATGYGIYWRIVEMLHEDQEHKLYLKPFVYEAISSTLKEETKLVKQIISYSIEMCELFILKDNYIYSERVLNNIAKRDKIKEVRSLAGKRSAELRSQKAVEKTVVAQRAMGKCATEAIAAKYCEGKKQPKVFEDISASFGPTTELKIQQYAPMSQVVFW